jgi:hypothetical protein|tara:strand:+ start:1193 stop:1384 length:192 start_codon:yes stop_codon:yes gene_type:complete
MEKEICFPYAYGRLNASLDWLTSGLERDCIQEGINVDDKVFELLKERIEKIRTIAVEESYDKH